MVGNSLGPYKILEQLGAGGMGEVYLAEDSRLGRKVAIKVLPTQFAADPERLARFEQEARAAAALNHPNIAVVHDIGAEDGEDGETTHFIVQEYLEGESLRQLVDVADQPRRRRLHHIADARIEIEDALSSGPVDPAASGSIAAASVSDMTAAPPAAARPRPLWQRAVVWEGLVAVGMIFATSILSNFERTPTASSVMRLPVQVSPGMVLDTGVGRAVTISPDGSKLAYVAAGRLFVRFLDQLEPRELAADNARMPFFSPDGQWIGFFTGRELKKVSVNGGTPLTLATTRDARGVAPRHRRRRAGRRRALGAKRR